MTLFVTKCQDIRKPIVANNFYDVFYYNENKNKLVAIRYYSGTMHEHQFFRKNFYL